MCNSQLVDPSFLTFKQLITATTTNFVLMSAVVITNVLVIYVLIKTKQLSEIIFKLIFILSGSYMLLGRILSQGLLGVTLHVRKCSVNNAFVFFGISITFV